MTPHRRSQRTRLSFESLEARQVLASFVVVNTNDSGDGSLREAILNSNLSPGRDRIEFAIADANKSIEPVTPLPAIVDQVIIDATTQPGYQGIPLVELHGTQLGAVANGLTIQAGNSVVRGLAINSFPGDGILITGLGGNIIESNYLGFDLTSQILKGNGGSGVQILESSNNRIGGPGVGNVLSGNRLEGLRVWGVNSVANTVEGNRIGTDPSGSSSIGNGISGVLIAANATGNFIGLGPADSDVSGKRNIISGNRESGIRISGTSLNYVKGNYIGLDVTGTRPLGNRFDGLLIEGNAAANFIGSNSDGLNDELERNWISGNGDNGIRIFNAFSTQISGNWIGLGTDSKAIPNANNGILIDGKSSGNVVGFESGVPDTERNIISGNAGSGIEIFDSTSNRISGNYIGTSPDGQKAIPNMDGVVVAKGGDNNIIGLRNGGVPQMRNLISGNQRNGVWLVESANSKVAGNWIGLAADGKNAIPNQHSGVWISQNAHDNVIGTDYFQGSTSELERNVISGNLLQGVSIGGTGADNNQVAGNWIGTDTTGLISIPNQTNGVVVYDGAKKNSIGGSNPDQQNFISGNQGWGISLEFNSSETKVLGNRIGFAAQGLAAMGNSVGGIRASQSINNQIGDSSPGGSNWISNNGAVGIQVIGPSSSGNAIINNYITNHSFMQLDLGGDGPTTNDVKDEDTGPNQLQNYPIIDVVGVSSSRTQISGKLESTPNSTFVLDLFAQIPGTIGNQADANLLVTTDSNGLANWLFEPAIAIDLNSVVYATARNAAGSQSEISPGKQTGRLFTIQVVSNQLREGSPSLEVTLQRPSIDTSQTLTVTLTSSDTNQLTVPAQVVIPAGQTSITFLASAVDDTVYEKPSLVRIIAETTQPSLVSGAIQITVLDNDSQWHNYAMPMDVDSDRDVTPLDVITIINYLNSNQDPNLATQSPPTPRSYLDVDDDLFASPLDVLILINHLNRRSRGEGESPLLWAMDLDGLDSWKRKR